MNARLASFSADGRALWGLARPEGMVDLTPDYPQWPGLSDVAGAGALAEVAGAGQGRDVTHREGRFEWDIPLKTPGKIICVGVNYPDRNAEYKDGQDAPPNPSLFIRFAQSFVGNGAALIRPPESPQLDYEGEVAMVISRPGRRIAREKAYSHIGALTLANEGTIRDWLRHAKFNVTQGKNWDRSGAMGPFLTLFHDPGQIADIALTTRVNGEIRQRDRTSRMLFPPDFLIAYISTFTSLAPGDVILTGTPTGAGARFDPPIWLKPGDLVEVEADGLGCLANIVADELPGAQTQTA